MVFNHSLLKQKTVELYLDSQLIQKTDLGSLSSIVRFGLY